MMAERTPESLPLLAKFVVSCEAPKINAFPSHRAETGAPLFKRNDSSGECSLDKAYFKLSSTRQFLAPDPHRTKKRRRFATSLLPFDFDFRTSYLSSMRTSSRGLSL